MAKFNINQISGNGNVFGDNNVVNNYSSHALPQSVLSRDDYFTIINELIELERLSLGDYLEDRKEKLKSKNPDFIKLLYKDVHKVLEDYDGGKPIDLTFENGDSVIEYGDFKLTGNPTNLHYTLIWLHQELIEGFAGEKNQSLSSNLERFEKDFLNINYDNPTVKAKIKVLKEKLKMEEKKESKSEFGLKDINEILHLKPNLMGIGININEIFSKILKRKQQTINPVR